MSGVSHTPGPWEAQLSGVIYDSKGIPVKVASGWIEDAWRDNDQTDETRANTRLIAAAPELLEALEELIGDYSGGAEHALDDEYVVERARAAIAKARGEA